MQVQPQIMNLQSLENKMVDAKMSLMNLDSDEQIADGAARSFGILNEVVNWANEIVENVAESKRIEAVL